MNIKYKIPDTLPWIYKKSTELIIEIPNCNIPDLTIGEKYYTNIEGLGWTQVIVKSFVVTSSTIYTIVVAPNGKEYGIRPHASFCKTIEDVKQVLLENYSKRIKGYPFIERFKGVLANCEFINKSHFNTFEGYFYRNGNIRQSRFYIKCLWIDEDGIHYEINLDIEKLYPTKNDVLNSEFKVMTFDDIEVTPILNKYLVTVEVCAENYNEAKKKVKIE